MTWKNDKFDESFERIKLKVGNISPSFSKKNKVVSIEDRLAKIDNDISDNNPELNNSKRTIVRNNPTKIAEYSPKLPGQSSAINSGLSSGPCTGINPEPYSAKDITDHSPQLFSFKDLKKNPLSVVLLVYELSWEHHQKVTPKLTYQEICYMISNRSAENVRSAIKWCRRNGMLILVESRSGPKGYVVLKLPDNLFEEIDYGIKKRSIVRINYKHIPSEELRCNSSSSLNKNITTTNKPELIVDISPLSKIGFQACHVEQLRGTFTSDQLQQSINHFAYALDHNPEVANFKKPPLSVLMGVLKKGQSWVESDYKTPYEIKYGREIEEKNKKLDEEKKKVEELQRNLTNIEYNLWRNNLVNSEKVKILSNKPNNIGENIFLRDYFVREIKKNKHSLCTNKI